MRMEESNRGLERLRDEARELSRGPVKPKLLIKKLDRLLTETARPVDQAAVFLNKLSDTLDRYARYKLHDPIAPRAPSRPTAEKRRPEPDVQPTWQEKAVRLGRRAARTLVMNTSRGLRALKDWLLR